MDKNDNVHIPKNVKKELELFRGFGIKELMITIFIAVILLLPCVLIYKNISQVAAISIFFTCIATTVMLVTKDDKGVSFFYQLKLVIKHITMQKKFKYRKDSNNEYNK